MARKIANDLNGNVNLANTQALTCGSASERVTGIEPALSAWEADVLPLNYTRADAATAGR
jgi:hypothetical protein